MAIKVLSARGSAQSEIARLLGVTEGAVRYHAKRMAAGRSTGGRSSGQRPRRLRWRSSTGAGNRTARVSIWRHCTSGCGGSMVMTAACARYSDTGGAASPRRLSGRGVGSRRRPGRRRRWTGRISQMGHSRQFVLHRSAASGIRGPAGSGERTQSGATSMNVHLYSLYGIPDQVLAIVVGKVLVKAQDCVKARESLIQMF